LRLHPAKLRFWRSLGPGLISGASDDDPTAIGTYAQTGAKFGFAFCWVALALFPFMVAIQEMSARLGRSTGRGLAGNIRLHYPKWLLQGCVALLWFANTVEIGADLGAMAEVLRSLIGGPQFLFVALFAGACVLLQVFMSYPRYVAVLKWSTLALFAYVAVLFTGKVDWAELASALVPHVRFDRDWLLNAVALFGVAVSPYIFFWQSSQEAEDQRVVPEREPLKEAPEQAHAAIDRIRIDTYLGMAAAVAVGLAIMIASTATLHGGAAGQAGTIAQFAEALRPITGPFAFAVFALGILGTGFLAVPVLAGSAAYAIGEARGWPVGLARKPREAKAFYVTLTLAAVLGAALNALGLDVVRALYGSAIINGIVAVPVLAMLTLMTGHQSIMGPFTVARPIRAVGWCAVFLAGAAVVALAASAL
jgi:NRAMP (natural resistance-associated macrophage protein)-like metal ion transporter